ncbi:MAG: NAD(P)/FAD-dependent oxidoreductase [Alphaproteobacteria bacterium]|nr:NAD(P)/FAD-dependent oxidoreductase [Alphaproteobacteria bacterium]
MAQASYDALILGAGHNGLTCGAYLAKAGLKVLVLERRHLIGGAAVTEEVVPGFRWSVASYVMSLLSPRVINDLELRKFGLAVLPANDLFVPLEDGDHIVFHDDVKKTQAQFARFSKHDAEIYPEFDQYLREATNVVRRLLYETPVDPSRRDWKSFRDTASLVWRYRDVAGKMYRIADLMTQSVYDYLSRWFESDTIKAVLAYYASIGTFAGPKSPGTAYVLMHHVMGEHAGAGGWGFVRGGMGAISNSIAESAKRWGMETRINAPIERVLVESGRAVGVALKGGEEIRAKLVASNANAKTLYLKLVERKELPADFVADIESYRTFSTAFKINIACERPPQYKAFSKAKAGFDYPTYVHLGPTIEYLERAYDEAKYGDFSSRPFITPVCPTIVDDTLAPKGKHVVNLFGGHAPYTLKGKDWNNERGRFVDTVMKTMDGFAPGFSGDVIDMQVLLPPDLEELIGLPQGHIFHGELSPDQLFFQRPAPHYADYRSPIKGLYLCGSSAHPGGGVSGIPGYNAAREILKDLGK